MTPEAAYQALFDARPDLVADPRRSDAIRNLAFPRRDEAWRFTPPRALLTNAHAPGAPALRRRPPGITGLTDTPAEVLALVGRSAQNHGFRSLNLAFFNELAVVHAPEGTSFDPVELTFEHSGLSVPRVLIVAEPRAQISVCVRHRVGNGLAAPVVEIVARDGSRVSFTQLVAGAGDLVGAVAVAAGTGSEVTVQTVVTAHTGTTRLELDVDLASKAHFHASGLVLARGVAHVDQHLHLVHAANDATSTQRFRNILDGTARAVFTGQVDVSPGITGSDASQSVNTLLLTDGPSIVTRPWLQIHNDQVRASHGASVGRLDPEALFYLRARGIGVHDASRLLVRAFAGEVIDTVPASWRDAVDGLAAAWLDGQGP